MERWRDGCLSTEDTSILVELILQASGLLGEDPIGVPANLVPYVAQVLTGKRPLLSVFGDNWETRDGTGVRGFIHVVDLANCHTAALEHGVFCKGKEAGCKVYNLGSGTGYSVIEMIKQMSVASGREIPYKIVERRPGDVGEEYVDVSKALKALKELHWKMEHGVEEICKDAWN
jgi:UDP-glucose 4-epimerase